MRIDEFWKAPNAVAIGTGLVCLDVVLNERREVEPKLWTGGTCGNVLAGLAYLGWESYPVARLKPDAASRLIHRDLRRWGVDRRYLSLHPVAPTPIIVHRLRRTAGGDNFHTFSLNCPDCGAHLPTFRPVPISAVDAVRALPAAQVFFVDRVAPGTVALAERSAKTGALVVFEPAGIGDERLFERMLRVAHVVKYSNERLGELPLRPRSDGFLEVQTLGHAGLRYRAQFKNSTLQPWQHSEAFRMDAPIDTAGAGDWCTVGILHVIGRGGLHGFMRISSRRLEDAMKFGQALASWTCGFEGARGGMYEQTRSEFRKSVAAILRTRSYSTSDSEGVFTRSRKTLAGVCSDCRRGGRRLLSRLHVAS